jgi:catechol 2,3-dioxygenase-like lactoylglutathione lyase family enzyme
MTIQRMDHVGIVVDDLVAATAFFAELGLELQGEWPIEGGWVDRIVGLEGVRAESAMLQTPDGDGRLELVRFHAPSGRIEPRPSCSVRGSLQRRSTVAAGRRRNGNAKTAPWRSSARLAIGRVNVGAT